jgi:hypothetical protein
MIKTKTILSISSLKKKIFEKFNSEKRKLIWKGFTKNEHGTKAKRFVLD